MVAHDGARQNDLMEEWENACILEPLGKMGRTAFVIATQRGYVDILKVLVESKADAGEKLGSATT